MIRVPPERLKQRYQ